MTKSVPAKKDLIIIIIIFAITFLLYWLSAWRTGSTETPPNAYFNELAESFLDGKLFLENPQSVHDLTLYQSKWYVPFLPLPSFLMLPWIALFGTINTVVFSAVLGAVNVCLVFLIIRGLIRSSWIILRYIDSIWLTILFGIGSVHWYISTFGSVWYISQLSTVTFSALAVWLTIISRKPFLAGLALGAALWARPHIILIYPLLVGIGYMGFQETIPNSRKTFLIRWISSSILPLFVSIFGILFYNWLRFDSMLDFGYVNENVATHLRFNLTTYGQFNLRYIPQNLWAMLLALPSWDGKSLIPDGTGMSLLITSPALIFLFKARQRSPIVLGAWFSVLLILIPLMLYYNTGWYQFGYRFSLDFMIPLMVLLAYASQEKLPNLMKVLIVLGVFVNMWGITWRG
ncbi:MAG: hypothetical protein CVU39_21145 [Chloroflexi bacterium HGW-Chloroflexi-10]|nr:MAG: hypothetical protein CVU39_21145 [Chloroflexi bacterium HGW-Chloroflexi-10]